VTRRDLFLIGSLAVGGAEVQLIRLANGLDRSRFAPTIVCLSSGGELEDLIQTDVPVIKLNLAGAVARSPLGRPFLAMKIFGALMGSFRRVRPDIVHAYLPAAYVVGGLVAWVMRIRVIVAGRRGLTSFDSYGTLRWRVLGRIVNHIIDVQICNSRAVRDWAVAREALPIGRTRVVYNGIDVPQLTDRPQLPSGWAGSGVNLAMVANFIRYKGHREVLMAFARTLEHDPRQKLILIGDGPERAALVELTRELGIESKVVFAGRRRDAAELLPAFDFTILGSSQEGFPNALLESMACGVPAVATAVGGVPELLEDFITGRLVAYGDVRAMADAMAWMTHHQVEREEIGRRARQLVHDRFSTERMVRATEAVYAEFLPQEAAVAIAD